jgi:hypothetical protein
VAVLKRGAILANEIELNDSRSMAGPSDRCAARPQQKKPARSASFFDGEFGIKLNPRLPIDTSAHHLQGRHPCDSASTSQNVTVSKTPNAYSEQNVMTQKKAVLMA